MATTTKAAALVLMLSVSGCFALPSWRNFEVADNRLVPASSGYVEPSSRDLDIGFTVGGDDDVTYPIRSGHVAMEGYRDKSLEDLNIGVIRDRPVPMYTSSGAAEGGWETPGGERVFYPRYPSSGTAEGGRVEPGGGRGFYPKSEYPGVISQPLDYKVGELKLRSDKGYQLSMHVPPSSLGDRPGVLKIDMKATLYRPIYY